jgi:hypothetical protein
MGLLIFRTHAFPTRLDCDFRKAALENVPLALDIIGKCKHTGEFASFTRFRSGSNPFD